MSATDPAVSSLMLQALRAYRSGQFAEAAEIAQRVVDLEENNLDALHLSAGALTNLRRLPEALAAYNRILVLRPEFPEAWNNRATALRYAGRLAESLESYDKALALRPAYPEALSNRGNALRDLGRLDEALDSYERALGLRPDYPEALLNRGALLSHHKRFAEALEAYDRALVLRPTFVEALSNRGAVLRDLGRPDEALDSYDRALALRPDFAEALCNRGAVLGDLKRFPEALEHYDRALALQAVYPNAWTNRGSALRELGRLEEGLESHNRALALQPEMAEALYNRGKVLTDLKLVEEGIASYDRALAARPDYMQATWNKSFCHLVLGRLREGWSGYENRRLLNSWVRRDLPGTEWTGNVTRPLRLFLYAEQGLGDTIQFARFARQLAAQGFTVTLAVQKPIVALIETIGRVEVVSTDDPITQLDAHCPLMSVPHLLDADAADVRADRPYLSADPARVEQWAARVTGEGLRVGIGWQGNPKTHADRGRSIPLAAFAPLARLDGVSLISLQKEFGVEQIAQLPADCRITTLEGLDEGGDAFLDTAAVMASLDLVITSDTALAHLAGALGCPVWIGLQHVPDWRWLLEGATTPWYASARLFRQPTRGDWASVVDEMKSALLTEPLASRGPKAVSFEPRAAQTESRRLEGGDVLVPISAGELLDRISILQIKLARIADPSKRANVARELALLSRIYDERKNDWGNIHDLEQDIRIINEMLWNIEDRIRRLESEKRFDQEFIEVARRVYINNDERARIKRRINERCRSSIFEEKSHND